MAINHNKNAWRRLRSLLLAVKILRDFLVRKWVTWLRREQWNIGIVYEPIEVFLKSGARPDIHWFATPKRHRFLADPFGVARDGEVIILCEDFDYRAGKAVISSIEFSDGVFSGHTKTVMRATYHMSYPYLLEHQGKIYCIPETFRAREISLYQAKEFPHKWEKVVTLIHNIAGVDATVFQYEELWWLTCTDHDRGPNHNLFVWYAPDLMGPWQPHAANPVKTDIRSSRPAGTPFIYRGYLYRPSQDCSRHYGGRIVLNRVIRLTPTEFIEEQAAVIEPSAKNKFRVGIHTVSSVGGYTLIDGRRYFFTVAPALRAVCTLARMLFAKRKTSQLLRT